jgi:methyl-accepting chemotaxis protein
MSTENTQSLTGPTLDPLGSDGRPLSELSTEIVERLRRVEDVKLAPQTNGQKSSAKENEPEAKAAQEAQNVDIIKLSSHITALSSNISMFKWVCAITVAIFCAVNGFFINNMSNMSNNIIALSARIDGLSNKIDRVSNRMDDKIDGLSNRMDGLSNRMADLSSKIDSINSTLSARIVDLMKMVLEIRDERVKKLGESTRPDPVKDQTPSRAPAKN